MRTVALVLALLFLVASVFMTPLGSMDRDTYRCRRDVTFWLLGVAGVLLLFRIAL